jgi:hypothetical protein
VAGVTARREDRAVREARRPRRFMNVYEARIVDRLLRQHGLDVDVSVSTYATGTIRERVIIRFNVPDVPYYPDFRGRIYGDTRINFVLSSRLDNTLRVEVDMPPGYLGKPDLLDAITDFVAHLVKIVLRVWEGRAELKDVKWRYRDELYEIIRGKLRQHNLDLTVGVNSRYGGSMMDISFWMPLAHSGEIYYHPHLTIRLSIFDENTIVHVLMPKKYLDEDTIDLIIGLIVSLHRLLSTAPVARR